MTWMQIGVGVVGLFVASAGVALAGWFGIWAMVDRRFTELRGVIDRANENNDKAHGELRTEIRDLRTETNTRLDTLDIKVGALAADVHVLVGRQQERDRDRAD